jgi:hypothetical protein
VKIELGLSSDEDEKICLQIEAKIIKDKYQTQQQIFQTI